MKSYQFQNIVWKEGKYYVALCLNVDVSSFGKTKPEALENLNEALELYFEDQQKINIQEVSDPEITSSSLQHA